VGEKNRLSSVIGHLVENAQQATAQDGFVHVSLAVEGDDNHILIEDNGCGMDGAFVRERLFRPFDTTRGNAGMGIGMYESREYIRALGGDIGVRSEPGKGTRVRVRLPAHRPAVDTTTQSSPAAAAATPYPAS
jgi:signal transduction histidine kinase